MLHAFICREPTSPPTIYHLWVKAPNGEWLETTTIYYDLTKAVEHVERLGFSPVGFANAARPPNDFPIQWTDPR